MLATDPLVGLTDYASALGAIILRILIFIELFITTPPVSRFCGGTKAFMTIISP